MEYISDLERFAEKESLSLHFVCPFMYDLDIICANKHDNFRERRDACVHVGLFWYKSFDVGEWISFENEAWRSGMAIRSK